MKKRIVSMLMAGIMTVGMLTGCGGTGGEETKTSADSQTTEAAGSGTTTDAAASSTAGTAADEETVTVKWLMWGDKAPDHDLVMADLNEKLREKINVELDLELISAGEFNDKVKLASTAGEDFDLVFTASWRNNFTENMSRDAFLPMDDLLAEYGQDMVAAIPDWLITVGQVDGVQYAIPNQQIIAKQYGFIVQKDLADKYGFDKTSLTDIREMEPFLEEIAANEPTLFPVDLRELSVDTTYDRIINDHVVVSPELEALPFSTITDDTARLYNEWYQKGYVRQDINTVTDNTADVKANRYACTLGTYKPGWAAEQSARLGKEYIEVPIEGAFIGATSGIETMTAINVNSRNPEAAMKLLNLIYTDKEIFNELLFGIEGTHYNKTGENSIEQTGDTYGSYGTMAWALGNQFNAYLLPGQEEGLWEETDKLNREATVSPLRGFTFNPENVQSELAQLAAVKEEYKNGEFVATDIDAFLAEKAEKAEAAGLTTVIEEVQRQIDEWKASK